MKNLNIEQLDEKDEEIADILISLGMSKNAATALSYLQNKNAAKSIDLERVARLRQLENQHIKAVEETQAKIERLKELGN